MEGFLDTIVDFIRVRQLNFAVAGLLTIVYLVYQYWGALFREKSADELEECSHSMHRLPRSRSRSCSRSRTRAGSYHDHKVDKHGSRRRPYGRCPDCSKCTLDD